MSAAAGSPIVETRVGQGTANGNTFPCKRNYEWWWFPTALALGLISGLLLSYMCIPVPVPVKTRETKLKTSLKFTEKKSLHAEFTESQFHELCKNIDFATLCMTADVECFTRQGPLNETMYGTICKGWQLWQLHASVDDDDPDQDVDSVREMIRCNDGLSFPLTGYFFVETDEFEEASRRAQELEQLQTIPLLHAGVAGQPPQGAPGGPPLFQQQNIQYQPNFSAFQTQPSLSNSSGYTQLIQNQAGYPAMSHGTPTSYFPQAGTYVTQYQTVHDPSVR